MLPKGPRNRRREIRQEYKRRVEAVHEFTRGPAKRWKKSFRQCPVRSEAYKEGYERVFGKRKMRPGRRVYRYG